VVLGEREREKDYLTRELLTLLYPSITYHIRAHAAWAKPTKLLEVELY
jgi:hypothetical protein